MFFLFFLFFFFNDTATTEIYTLSLHDALPICGVSSSRSCPYRHDIAQPPVRCPEVPGVLTTSVSMTAPSGRRASEPLAPLRVAKNAAAVQVGTRSKKGTSSAMKLGRKAQCHPTNSDIVTATPTSRTSLTIEVAPPAKTGKTTICRKSAAIATPRAARIRAGVKDRGAASTIRG